MRRARIAVVAVVAISLLSAAALALAASGPSVVSPPNAKSYKRGFPITFRVRSPVPENSVFISVSKSSRKDSTGVIAHEQYFRQMKREGTSSIFRHKSQRFPALSSYWLNKPGRYYWQAYRISCGEEESDDDCNVEGPVRTVRIRR